MRRLSRIGWPQLLVLGIAAGLLVLFAALPLAIMLVRSFSGGLAPIWSAWTDSLNLRALGNTVSLTLATLAFTLALGVPLGWLFGVSDLPGRAAWRSLCTVPYVLPPYIGAIAWIQLANPSNGLLNRGGSWLDIYTIGGMAWVLGLAYTPFVFTATANALERVDPALEEAARIAGASPFRAFTSVTLPVLFPALGAASSFVMASTAAAFGVPYLLAAGTAEPHWVLTTRIYQALDLSPATGRPLAVALSLGLLTIGVGLPALGRLFEGRRSFTTVTGKANRGGAAPLGRFKPLALAVVGLYAVLAVGMPLLTLVGTSLMRRFSAGFSADNLSVDNYTTLLAMPRTTTALGHSLLLAALAATAAVLLGALIAYLSERTQTPGRHGLATLAGLPYAVPGTVLALGLLLTFSQPLRLILLDRVTFTLSLRDTMWMLGLAYMVKFLAFPVGNARAGLKALHPSLEEAARLSGASWGRSLRDVVAPLLRPQLIAAWFLVFMPAFSEITMSILLFGPDTEVVGTLLFNLQAYGDPPAAAVLAVVLTALVLSGNALLRLLSGGKVGL